MSDNVYESERDRPTVNPIVLEEYTFHFAFHSGMARQAVGVVKSKSAGVDRLQCILIAYHGLKSIFR